MAIDPLQLLVTFSRLHAKQTALLRKTVERMFLLGIEIGRGEPLSAKEKARYARTQATARQVLVMRGAVEDQPQQEDVEAIITHALVNWLREEPSLKKIMEEWCHKPIDDRPEQLPTEQYLKLKSQIQAIALATGKPLADEDVEQLAQKLLFPFDRP